jgi:hypothetical protein
MTPEVPSGPEHWRPATGRHDRTGDRASDSVLGPADPDEMAWAAEELRARTMSLEEAKFLPPLRFVVVTLVTVFTAAALMVLFRSELRAFLRLHGL